MIIHKITDGFVIQSYDDETMKWTKQEFVAGHNSEYEDEDGEVLDNLLPAIAYLPFTMVQPSANGLLPGQTE